MVDSAQGPVEEFAAWLRQMRLVGGDLSVRELVRRTEQDGLRVARSTLQDALDAKRLPSIDNAVAMVRAMTGDEAAVDDCRTRWWRARSAVTGVPMPPPPAPPSARRPHSPAVLPPSAAVPRTDQAGADTGWPRVPAMAPERLPVWKRKKTALISFAAVLAVAAGSIYGVYAADSPRSSSGAPNPTHSSTPGAATAAAGTASAPLPPYLHIQAEVGGCLPTGYYDETAAQYQQHPSSNGRRVGQGTIDITNQTSSNEAVLLTGLHVLVRHRQPAPTTGIVVGDGQCGAAQAVRPFTTDLDKPGPVAIAQPDPGGPNDPGHPPVTFPFKISPGDPEVFELTAKDTTCDCAIAVEIDWVAAGKAGKTILDNGGHGFSVLAAPDLPAYQLGGPHNDKLVPAKYKDIVLGS
ncbi:hypothetical protein [Actinacidiphila oryziradicis]|uniref:Helix-turn-helix domain-containing protein n=1 Tax=Actinacidiphila oryziradicis TaxID=2571141 RepID=A0A4U0RJG2_9ACTN|nr:hypothetical protein [Actinacidiphila oryziradicis]TJZ94870.1 hypothetical protein FCI23_52840 [Actinacidiphila oryziradicis]